MLCSICDKPINDGGYVTLPAAREAAAYVELDHTDRDFVAGPRFVAHFDCDLTFDLAALDSAIRLLGTFAAAPARLIARLNNLREMCEAFSPEVEQYHEAARAGAPNPPDEIIEREDPPLSSERPVSTSYDVIIAGGNAGGDLDHRGRPAIEGKTYVRCTRRYDNGRFEDEIVAGPFEDTDMAEAWINEPVFGCPQCDSERIESIDVIHRHWEVREWAHDGSPKVYGDSRDFDDTVETKGYWCRACYHEFDAPVAISDVSDDDDEDEEA